jgi:hypothetical protein
MQAGKEWWVRKQNLVKCSAVLAKALKVETKEALY